MGTSPSFRLWIGVLCLGPWAPACNPSDPVAMTSGLTTAQGSGAPPTTDGGTDGACSETPYSETLPPTANDVSAIVADFDNLNLKAYLLRLLDQRYPLGATLIRDGRGCFDAVRPTLSPTFFDSPSSAAFTATIFVHECGHFVNGAASTADRAAFLITEDAVMACDRFPTPARGAILNDNYAPLRPPCPANGSHGCDPYTIYLDGQGFADLMEELVQFINSLAVAYALDDVVTGESAERDGLLTQLWYLTRYLKLLAAEDVDTYERIVGDDCWRELIQTAWQRAQLFLDATLSIDDVGLEDEVLADLVNDSELLAEIEALGCEP